MRVIFIAMRGLWWQGANARLNRAQWFDEADHMRGLGHSGAPPKVVSPESAGHRRCRSRVGATVSGTAAQDPRAESQRRSPLSPSAPTRSPAGGVGRRM